MEAEKDETPRSGIPFRFRLKALFALTTFVCLLFGFGAVFGYEFDVPTFVLMLFLVVMCLQTLLIWMLKQWSESRNDERD